jgi:hypothetical protein
MFSSKGRQRTSKRRVNNHSNHNAKPVSSLFPRRRSKGITSETAEIATTTTPTTATMNNAFYHESDILFLYRVLSSSCFPLKEIWNGWSSPYSLALY